MGSMPQYCIRVSKLWGKWEKITLHMQVTRGMGSHKQQVMKLDSLFGTIGTGKLRPPHNIASMQALQKLPPGFIGRNHLGPWCESPPSIATGVVHSQGRSLAFPV